MTSVNWFIFGWLVFLLVLLILFEENPSLLLSEFAPNQNRNSPRHYLHPEDSEEFQGSGIWDFSLTGLRPSLPTICGRDLSREYKVARDQNDSESVLCHIKQEQFQRAEFCRALQKRLKFALLGRRSDIGLSSHAIIEKRLWHVATITVRHA
jgi:hypothetical protein